MRLLSLFLAFLLSTSLPPSLAYGEDKEPSLPFIRDAEVEQLLRDYTKPIFAVAGVGTAKGAVQVFLLNDRAFNAFVADGRKIFINTGALMNAKTPNEIIGVLAHETGHIAGGHLIRMHQEMAKAQAIAVIGTLLGAGAAATAMRSSTRGPVGSDSTGVMGAIMGPTEIARRSLLAYQRGEEEAADRAAVKFLDATKQSSKGLLSTLERFQNEALFATSHIDPYLMSHPLPQERLSNLSQVAKASPYYQVSDPPALQARHDLMRAKLFGFMGEVGEVSRRYPLSDMSLAARYARAISTYRFGHVEVALRDMEALIQSQPRNPYFHELKGQCLLEAGRPAEAIAALRIAVQLAPQGTPIQVLLGHALVATHRPADREEAIRVLSRAVQQDEDNQEAYVYLAMAYNQQGDVGQAQLAAAQALFQEGKFQEARTQAARAQKILPAHSPGWLKADDILNYRPPKFD